MCVCGCERVWGSRFAIDNSNENKQFRHFHRKKKEHKSCALANHKHTTHGPHTGQRVHITGWYGVCTTVEYFPASLLAGNVCGWLGHDWGCNKCGRIIMCRKLFVRVGNVRAGVEGSSLACFFLLAFFFPAWALDLAALSFPFVTAGVSGAPSSLVSRRAKGLFDICY